MIKSNITDFYRFQVKPLLNNENDIKINEKVLKLKELSIVEKIVLSIIIEKDHVSFFRLERDFPFLTSKVYQWATDSLVKFGYITKELKKRKVEGLMKSCLSLKVTEKCSSLKTVGNFALVPMALLEQMGIKAFYVLCIKCFTDRNIVLSHYFNESRNTIKSIFKGIKESGHCDFEGNIKIDKEFKFFFGIGKYTSSFLKNKILNFYTYEEEAKEN